MEKRSNEKPTKGLKIDFYVFLLQNKLILNDSKCMIIEKQLGMKIL